MRVRNRPERSGSDRNGTQQTSARIQRQAKRDSNGFITQIDELREYATHYVAAKIDKFKLTLRRVATVIILGLLGLTTLLGLLFASVWFVVKGAAEGLAILLGDRLWLGQLLCGLLLLLLVGLSAAGVIYRWSRKSHFNTVLRYERRQQQQKAKFGHDAHEQAVASQERSRVPRSTGGRGEGRDAANRAATP